MSKEKLLDEKREVAEEFCKYEFSEKEKREIADMLAGKITEFKELEDRKKAMMSDIKGIMDSVSLTINKSARQIKDGYETRYINCYVNKNFDTKKVEYERVDTGEIVRTREMTEEDMQTKMSLKEAQEKTNFQEKDKE